MRWRRSSERVPARGVIPCIVLLTCGLSLPWPAAVDAQSEEWPIPSRLDADPDHTLSSIVDRMIAAADQRAAGITDYTVHETMSVYGGGGESLPSRITTYYRRAERGGHAVFDVGAAWVDGSEVAPEPSPLTSAADHGPILLEHGRYVARAMLVGRSQHVIELADPSAFAILPADASARFTPRLIRAFVDAEHFVLTRLQLDGVAMTQEGPRTVRPYMWMEDFSDHDGVLLPSSRGLRVDNYSALIDAELRAQLEQLRDMLEGTSGSRRAMIATQIDMIEFTLGDEHSFFAMVSGVDSVRVNAGPPEGGR